MPMKYRNVKTGFVLDTPCIISGKDWEVLSPSPEVKKEKAAEPKKTTRKSTK